MRTAQQLCDAFLRGELEVGEGKRAVAALFAGQAVAREPLARPGREGKTADYGEAFSRAWARARDTVAPAGAEHPNEWSRVRLRVEELLAASDRAVGVDLPRALRDAEAAVGTCRRVPAELAPPAARSQLLGRALCALARARRANGELEEVPGLLDEAEACFDRGLGDPLEIANLHRCRSALAVDRGDLVTAERQQFLALALYRQVGDVQREAGALVSLGGLLAEADQPARAIPLLHEALAKLERGGSPTDRIAACHNLARALFEAGRGEEALAVLTSARPLYDEHAPPYLVALRVWLEGKIALAAGRFWEASERLTVARGHLENLGFGIDAALVDLELAMALLGRGNVELARAAAREATAALRAAGLELDAWVGEALGGTASRLEQALPLVLAAARQRAR
jgi:tetratricopeptide (TPR) repeat protein